MASDPQVVTQVGLLSRVVLLAGAYYAVAKLGLSVGSLPGNVAPVWPPTGLSWPR